MSKKIVTIGFEMPSTSCRYEEFRSKVSLLDYDIILFRPTIDYFVGLTSDSYLGKPCLNDTLSFQLREASEHWRREIKQAIEVGKTVIVFMSERQQVHIATGQKNYSGTGRSRSTTRVVEPWTNYKTLPVSSEFIDAAGSSMKLMPQAAEIIGSFWTEFSASMAYRVILPFNVEEDSCHNEERRQAGRCSLKVGRQYWIAYPVARYRFLRS